MTEKKDEKQACNSLACSKSRKFKDISIGLLSWFLIGFTIFAIVGAVFLFIYLQSVDFGSLLHS